MTDEGDPTDGARARAASAARLGETPVAVAWALVAIADELAAIRREMHRQARASASAGRRG